MTQKTIDKLKENGFVKHDKKILNAHEINQLKNRINQLFNDKSIEINTSSNALVIENLIGIDADLDLLLAKLVTHEDVKYILSQILGENFKIWQLSVRRSIPGDTGLYLHQDAPGETGLSFLLSDNINGDGATAFLSKSHKLPRWSQKISWSNVSLSSPFLSPLRGRAGDLGFFFNRTWHARLKNKSNKTHDILLIGFYPSEVLYESLWNEKSLNQISQSELRRLCDQNDSSILSNKKNNIPYVMELENSTKLKASKVLALKTVLLHIIFLPIRWLYRVLRS